MRAMVCSLVAVNLVPRAPSFCRVPSRPSSFTLPAPTWQAFIGTVRVGYVYRPRHIITICTSALMFVASFYLCTGA